MTQQWSPNLCYTMQTLCLHSCRFSEPPWRRSCTFYVNWDCSHLSGDIHTVLRIKRLSWDGQAMWWKVQIKMHDRIFLVMSHISLKKEIERDKKYPPDPPPKNPKLKICTSSNQYLSCVIYLSDGVHQHFTSSNISSTKKPPSSPILSCNVPNFNNRRKTLSSKIVRKVSREQDAATAVFPCGQRVVFGVFILKLCEQGATPKRRVRIGPKTFRLSLGWTMQDEIKPIM